MPSIDPIQGDALKKALEDQHNAPRVWSAPPRMETSPTGAPYLPPRLIRPAMTLYVSLVAVLSVMAMEGNPLERYRFWLLLAIAVLGALLGVVSPGARKTLVLFVALTAASGPAWAERATLLRHPEEPAMRRDAAELAALFAPKGLAGVSVARGRSSPMALAVLSVGLARLGPGELDADLGGGFTRFDGAEIVAGSLGVSYLWQSGPLQVGPAAGALYSSAGWSFYGALALAFPVGP